MWSPLISYCSVRFCSLSHTHTSGTPPLLSTMRFLLQYYDIRKECEGSLCYDFSNMEKFLNQNSVKNALGVGELDFVSCSPTVYEAMITDWMRNLEVGIPALLEDGIQLLVYAGEYDLICNWLGKLFHFILLVTAVAFLGFASLLGVGAIVYLPESSSCVLRLSRELEVGPLHGVVR